jgi:hypothetical protein
VVFLLAPLLFYALAWTQLRYTFLVLDMGTYLRDDLIPKLRLSIEAAGPRAPSNEHSLCGLMGWEFWDASLLRREGWLRRILVLPIAGANYGVPLLASLASLAGYWVSDRGVDGRFERLLTALDLLLLGFSLVWGILAEIERGGHDHYRRV